MIQYRFVHNYSESKGKFDGIGEFRGEIVTEVSIFGFEVSGAGDVLIISASNDAKLSL